jgi:hypothetical protein
MSFFNKKIFSNVKVTKYKVFLQDNEKKGRFIIPKNFDGTVFLNGEKCLGTIEFNQNDSVTIDIKNPIVKEAYFELEINISKDHMTADLSKTIYKGKRKVLKAKIEENPILEIVVVDTYPESIPIYELEQYILLKGISGDIKEDVLFEISIAEENISKTVAFGKKPKFGKPAGFQLIKGYKNNTIIDKDIIFAEFTLGTIGESGYTVLGTPLFDELKTLYHVLGPNVLVRNTQLISDAKGKLLFNDLNIDIIVKDDNETTLNSNRDDDILYIDGDATLTEDSVIGRLIKCNGNLTIKGTVIDSTIFAEGDITIDGNIENTFLHSGFSNITLHNLKFYCLQYMKVLERVLNESNFSAFDGSNYISKRNSVILAKSELINIDNLFSPFLTKGLFFGEKETIQICMDFETIKTSAKKTILNDLSTQHEIKLEVKKFLQLIKKAKTKLYEDKGNISIKSANNSKLFSSNDIIVTGSGVFQTSIESLNGITIFGKSISSNLLANRFIEVNDFEAVDDIINKITVKKYIGHIKLNVRKPDTWIILGNKKNINRNLQKDVFFNKNNFPEGKFTN